MPDEKQQTGFNAWVEGFGCAMVDGLNRNAHKGGRENWIRDSPQRLLSRVEDEFVSLMRAVEEGADPMTVWAKAASVANMAGMVADSYAEHAKK